jgi:hypothetical protein
MTVEFSILTCKGFAQALQGDSLSIKNVCYNNNILMRYARWIVLGALFLSMGGHLPLLQSWAWVRMTTAFLQHDTLSHSIQKTFDGQNPCSLCLKVKKASRASGSLAAVQDEVSTDSLAFSTTQWLKKSTERSWTLRSIQAVTQDGISNQKLPPPKDLLA